MGPSWRLLFITLAFGLACSGKQAGDDDTSTKQHGAGAAGKAEGSAGTSGSGTGGATPTCNAGYARCGSSCIDLGFDGNNCGACGHRCSAGQTCREQVCEAIASGGSGGSTGGSGGTGGTGNAGTGGTTLTCSDSTHPVACPALGDVPASCWTPGTVCSTVTTCNGVERSCSDASEVYDCATSRCVASDSVNCQVGGPPAGAVCTCTSHSTSGTLKYTGPEAKECVSNPDVGCSGNDTLAEICCAEPGYPQNGAACSCYYDSTVWSCVNSGNVCTCSYSSQARVTADEKAGIATDTCDTTPRSDGTPWFCWTDRGECYCKEGISAVPSNFAMDETTVVSDCTRPTPTAVPGHATCPSGTKLVNACSSVPAPTCDEASCAASMCESGVCCTWSCQCGSCRSTCNN